MNKLMTHRYGRHQVPAAEARDVYRVRAMLEARALALNPDFVPELEGWSKRRLCLDAAAKAEIRQEVAADAIEVGPMVVGYLLHLHDAERDAVRFWRAVAVDMTDADRVEKHRADDAARKRRSRAAAGISAKGVRFAEARARDPYASRATLYRRIKSGKGAAHDVSR
ncbi:hypothetical protein MKK64_19120 [Methylobacterium sp. E-025]|uniref:hypothetical protein n=1 Tax=Methylobacterium sp. E-025 TaxID=2836561 RepID=UPI001FB9D544|nr:hypothetical protein [Methylobacterium sp. E-025]MCJ2113291.1 hypothetical protein [Methylobacterium sp. E-025]